MERRSIEKHYDSSSELNYEEYWIGDFMHRKENHGLVRVHDEFLEDKFNIVGLDRHIENLEKVYSAILDRNTSNDFIEESTLYYLIHQRYIFTKPGLEAVLDKVMNKEYGVCPRYGCKLSPVIPVGITDEPKISPTKVYCYNCMNIYEPKNSLCMLDGCAWGRSFPHFLILTYPYNFVKKNVQEYVPRIYGFRIYAHEDFDSPEEDQ